MDLENNFASTEIIDQDNLEKFQDGIENLKHREDLFRQSGDSRGHFEGEFDKSQLTEEDRKMWELKEELIVGQISPETVTSRFKVYQDELAVIPNLDPSRKMFGAFLSNEISSVLAGLELAKRRR